MVPNSLDDFGNCAQPLNDWLWVFPPNRLCYGNRAWWIGCSPQPVLIDCPPITQETISLLKTLSVDREALVVLTSREAHGRVLDLHNELGWPVLVQEQEEYLLPGISKLSSFSEEHVTKSGLHLLWTPGPTPGSCVLYAPAPLNVLFCGRLLIPLKLNYLVGVRTKRTFHWTRQKKSLKKLRQWLPRDQRPALASGAWRGPFDGGKLDDWEGWQEPYVLHP